MQPCLTRLRWSGGGGGRVTAGQAEIHSQGDLTTITQSSQNAAINWQSFSVAPQETVQFKQPNSDSITLNRVTGNEASDIQGQIKANGHIFISNPNGVLIGNNAQINVGGLVATTQKISDEDFMANRFNFTGEDKSVVENRGHIQVPKGGVVALVAPIVKNSGKITALQANTLLASAEQFSITLPNNNKFSYQISKGTLQGLVDNGGAILADGGYVVLTAKGLSAVKKSVINHSGTIQANTVSNKNGKIELLGDLDNSQLNVAGKLIAEAPNGGDGGFIETSAAKVKIDDNVKVSTKSTKGSSGTWLIDPNDFVIGGKNSDMTANTLSRQLDNGNVNIKSTNGKAEGKGDIIINKQVNWHKNKLTLSAQNDILINKTLNGTGTASLVMEYGLATSDGGESDFYLQKYVPLAERTAAINLPEGKNLRVRKGAEGEFTTFDVIHKMPEINEDGTNAEFPSNHIALGQDIDLSYTKTLNNPKFGGWNDKTDYHNQDASFWGLGHKVKNLYINATEVPSSYVGFLTNTYASIRDIGVEGEISSNTAVGGLAGRVFSNNNYNYIKNSYTNINIISSSSAAGLILHVSGNETNKTEVSNVYSIGNITVNNNNVGNIGGVFGFVYDAVIKDSYGKNKITVSNNDYTDSYIGGFIASSENSTISNSYFNGDISFSSGVAQGIGGLIGESRDNTILNSYSNGHLLVSGRSGSLYEGVGGLLGYSSDDSINNSYSLVTVNASESSYVGGLVGQSTISKGVQKINNSYSSGLVIGKNFVGGLVGYNRDSISIANSYSISNVRGEDSVGGLIGRSYGSVDLTNVYSSGEVSGKENVAGLYFAPFRTAEDNVANSYTLGNVRGEGNVKRFISSGFGYRGTTTNSGVLDDDALKDKSSFKNWDFENVWEIKDGQYPTLRNKPLLEQNQPKVEDKPKEVVKRFITITARNLNKVYDGIAVTKDNISTLNGWGTYGYDYSGELEAGDNISSFGRISFDGDWQGKIDAGNYKLVPYGLSSSKYEFKYNPSNLVINPRTLTIHILDSFVDENRHADPSSVGVIAEGLVGNDEIHPPKLVIAHEVILNDPNSKVEFKKGKASNYDIEFKEGNMIYLPHDKTRYNFPTDDYIENHSTKKIIENYYELIKDKGDELFLADVVYDSDFGERRIELRNSYNKMEKIRLLDKKSIIASGLQMALYEVVKDGKSHYVFAYRGTSSLTDLGIDLLSGVFTSPQHNGSIDITKEMLKKIPNNSSINYVGHSLGGSLATINAYVFGGDSVTTFNPLGLNHATIDAVRRNHVIKPIKHSANFILGNDIVNTINQTVSSDGLLGGNEKYIPIGLIGFKWIVSNSIGNHYISSIDKNFTSIESLYHNYKLWNKPGVKKVRKPMLSSLYWSSEEKMPEKISISPSKMSKHVTVMKKDSNNIVGYLSKNAHYIQDNPSNNYVKFIAVPVKFGSEALGGLFGALKKMNDIASLANKNDPHNLFASAVKKLGDNFVHNINRVQQDYRSKKISKKDAIDKLTHIKLDTSKQFIEMRKDAENKGIFLYILDYIVSAPNDEMIRTFNWIEKEIKSINVNELLN